MIVITAPAGQVGSQVPGAPGPGEIPLRVIARDGSRLPDAIRACGLKRVVRGTSLGYGDGAAGSPTAAFRTDDALDAAGAGLRWLSVPHDTENPFDPVVLLQAQGGFFGADDPAPEALAGALSEVPGRPITYRHVAARAFPSMLTSQARTWARSS